jgi:hypothetical protein
MQQKKYKGFSFTENGLRDNMYECIQAQPVSKNLRINTSVAHQFEFIFIPNEKLDMFKHMIVD